MYLRRLAPLCIFTGGRRGSDDRGFIFSLESGRVLQKLDHINVIPKTRLTVNLTPPVWVLFKFFIPELTSGVQQLAASCGWQVGCESATAYRGLES